MAAVEFVTRSPEIQKLLSMLPSVASSRASVLIRGESGTGKELIANMIHGMSSRNEQRMVAINCAAIPENLLESELFGYKKGSFTGAHADHKGLFETANGSTIFLDEIGDTTPALQAKLLRVLQERKVRSVGGKEEVEVDFRLIAATHRDLEAQVERGLFREDLFYRLNVIPLYIPPLRRRREDIPLLISSFAREFARQYEVKVPDFSPEVLHELCCRPWRGNIRELENFIERLLVLKEGQPVLGLRDLEENRLNSIQPPEWNFDFYEKLPTLSELNDQYIRYILERAGKHQGEAARMLGISRRTMSRKVASFLLHGAL